jgi:hypothetical protein
MIGTIPRRSRLNIAAIPACEFWIDCARPETLTFASGSNVTQVLDLSGKSRHMVKTGTAHPTVYPTYSATEKALFFLNDADDDMIAGAAADWKFLHDGTGATVLLMLKIPNDASSEGLIFANMTDENDRSGIMFFYKNDTESYRMTVRNTGGWTHFNAGAADTLEKGQTKILSVLMGQRSGNVTDLVTRSNGAVDIRAEPFDSYSASTPLNPLVIGSYPSAEYKARMYFKKAAIFSRRLSRAEEAMILSAWANEENIAITHLGVRDLAVIAGADNAVGDAAFSGTEFNTAPSVANARILDIDNYAWQTPLQAGVNNRADTSSDLGVEMKLAKEFVALSGKPLDIVKYGANNTSMLEWESGDTAFLNLQNAMMRAVALLEDEGYIPRPFFVWYQGEADAQDSGKTAAYETRLKNFLDTILVNPCYAQAPSYIVQITQEPVQTGTAQVQQSGMNISVTHPYSAYVHFVETADIVDNADTNRITADSHVALGARLARRALGIV